MVGEKKWSKIELRSLYNTSALAARAYHSATVALNDFIFILGGYDGTKLFKDILALDLRENMWLECGFINACRCKHTSTALSKDVILVFGGHDGKK